MDIAETVVPQWYLDARRNGKLQDALREQVYAFCLKALQRRAAQMGKQLPEHVEPELVEMTMQMYECAMQAKNSVE